MDSTATALKSFFPNAIIIWEFHDAPEELRDLSRAGGDEDWLALVPMSLADKWIGWMEEGGSFGCCCVQTFETVYHGLSYQVRIGSHA